MGFLHINFRSDIHMYWFVATMVMLVASGVITWLLHHNNYPRTFLLWEVLFYLYFVVGVGAVVATAGGKEWRFYSPNCVWFNLLIAMLYAVLKERGISYTFRLGLIGLIIALLVTFNAHF